MLVAATDDRPGVVAALTGVFSTRGVNVDTVVAVRGSLDGAPGTVVAAFRASERRARLLQRVVGRLDAVDATELGPHEGAPLARVLVDLQRSVDALTSSPSRAPSHAPR